MSAQINNNIQEAYCSFEVSKLLKEKGLDCGTHTTAYSEDGTKKISPYSSFYDPYKYPILNCTHSLAIEWIRVNFGIWITVNGDCYGDLWVSKLSVVSEDLWDKEDERYKVLSATCNFYNIHETSIEATEAALRYTLKNIIP